MDDKLIEYFFILIIIIEKGDNMYLKIISKTADNGEIMAIKHKQYNVYGLQFHPESILTPDGITIIENFINKIKEDN